jgi:carotenoid cleavage dioxygenase-like enzyme
MSALEITQRHGKALNPDGTPPPDAPPWIDEIDNPYLHGLFAPITHESESASLPVLEGEVPPDLSGAYFRNGPNNRYAPLNRYHWFDGDGMVHGVWFDGGEARYRSRWVQTRGFEHETDTGSPVWGGVLGPFDFSLPGGPLKDTANTDLVPLRDQLFALWYESGKLYSLDPNTLETRGVETMNGTLPRRISAHSKLAPNGDFIFFRYGDRPPYMTYGVARPDGTVHAVDITLPGPRRPHDIGVTPRFSILHDFPIFFDPERFKKTGKRIPLFHPDVPTRYGVIPRFGTDADVRWFEFEPCYMLHVVNCWEEGDEIVMVGCRTDDPSLKPDPRDGRIAAMLQGIKLQANLYEWRMDLATGQTSERKLDTLNAEFPRINPAWIGRKSRFSYHQVIPHEIPATFEGLVKYDLQTGTSTRHDYGRGVYGSEMPFAQRPGATEEDDGYLLAFMTDVQTWRSEVHVYDARDIEQGPVCRLGLPDRVPAGFHAAWMPGEDLGTAG